MEGRGEITQSGQARASAVVRAVSAGLAGEYQAVRVSQAQAHTCTAHTNSASRERDARDSGATWEITY